MKSGTTTLYEILGDHKEISKSRIKEPNFFLDENEFEIQDIKNYYGSNTKYYLEGSVQYTSRSVEKSIANKIYNYNKDSKFIYIIREPVSRIESHHWHAFNRGFTQVRNINKALFKMHYLEVSKYFSRVRPFIEKFGSENVLILLFEDLIKKKGQVARQISEFLELDVAGFDSINSVHLNKSSNYKWLDHRVERIVSTKQYKLLKRIIPQRIRSFFKFRIIDLMSLSKRPVLNHENKIYIQNELKEEIISIEKLISRDLSSWYK